MDDGKVWVRLRIKKGVEDSSSYFFLFFHFHLQFKVEVTLQFNRFILDDSFFLWWAKGEKKKIFSSLKLIHFVGFCVLLHNFRLVRMEKCAKCEEFFVNLLMFVAFLHFPPLNHITIVWFNMNFLLWDGEECWLTWTR